MLVSSVWWEGSCERRRRAARSCANEPQGLPLATEDALMRSPPGLEAQFVSGDLQVAERGAARVGAASRVEAGEAVHTWPGVEGAVLDHLGGQPGEAFS